MTYETILTEQRDRVGIIRLNRPEKLNAWTGRMHDELVAQVSAWNADEGIGAVVLTGEGRAFCAGADLNDFDERLKRDVNPTDPEGARGATQWVMLVPRSKPIIVAFNGYAVGVGLTLALPCDVRIAAEGARLAMMMVKVGIIPELGSSRLLAQLIGLAHATDMCLSGRMVEAEEAFRFGLVSEVVPKERLMDAALARAGEIANNPTPVVMMIKQLLETNPLDADIERVMEREQLRDRTARTWPFHKEAVQAFLEKRAPRFF